MQVEGGCYCGDIRYEIDGDALMKVQCHCRECQYISGGSPNVTMAMPEAGFSYKQGSVKQFQRQDLETPVVREFCGQCGTHILARSPSLPGTVLLKVGTLDDPAVFESPSIAIFMVDKQPFHLVAEGLPTFDRVPG